MTRLPAHDVVILIDDAGHAQHHLAPLMPQLHGQACTVVACAPRMTHRVSKWVSHTAREHWRSKWANRQFAAIGPWMARHGVEPATVLARGPVTELLEALRPGRLIDARRPRQHTGGESTSAQRYEARHDAQSPTDEPAPPGRRRGESFAALLLPLIGTVAMLGE